MSKPDDYRARPHRVLFSFHYYRKGIQKTVDRYCPHFPSRVFGDSGAFSAASLGKPITVDEYVAWLGENASVLQTYVNLDVIGDAEATARNQAAIERKGFAPLPVFHFGSDLKHLERLIDAGYPYICIGGMVGKRTDVLMRFSVQCFKLARQKNRGTVFHGFWLTSLPAIMSLPWYSVDSSSWASCVMRFEQMLFDPTKGAWVKVKSFSAERSPAEIRLLRLYGLDPKRVSDKKNFVRPEALGAAVRSWRALEDWCRRRHGPVGPVGSDDVGLHIYLSSSSATDTGHANHALANDLAISREVA